MMNVATRNTMLGTTLVLFTATLLCGQSSATSSTVRPTTSAQSGANMQTSANASSGDKQFVKEALGGSQAEVKLGKLAQQKSNSDDVKQFGQKMVTDHSQLAEQMKPVAQELNITPPQDLPAKMQALYSKLQNLSGDDFDRAYISAMVKDHQKDLSDFKKEASSGQNPQLKQAAQEGSSVIAEHLSMIKQIAQKHNVNVGSQNASGAQ